LTDEEWVTLRSHTTTGQKLLERWGADNRTIKAARQHHMYPKGGYPPKKPGEKMSQIGRLIDLVDAIEKMSSARHGKDPMPLETIIEEIKRGKNQFYLPYVKAFIRATRENPDFMRWWDTRALKMSKKPTNERLAPRRTTLENGVVRYEREEGARRFDQNR
jgi:response regulator RpfG family c-di-GMP phosphodiesterase